jgi:hypothetical protein
MKYSDISTQEMGKILISRNKIKFVATKHEGKSRVRRINRIFEDTIILDLKEIGCMGLNVVYLVLDTDQLAGSYEYRNKLLGCT